MRQSALFAPSAAFAAWLGRGAWSTTQPEAQQACGSIHQDARSVLPFDYHRKMEENEVVRALSALAHGLRLQVFRALVVVGRAGMTPGTMSEHLGIPAATLSFHLKELMNAHLVTQEREGRHLIYRASFDHISQVLTYLTVNCCRDEECLDERVASCKAEGAAVKPTSSRC